MIVLRLLTAAMLLLTLAPAARAEQRGSGWVSPGPSADAPEAIRAALLEVDRLHDTREQGSNGDKGTELLRGLAKTSPESFDVNWRIARALFWASEAMTDKDRRRTLATEGWDAGKKALAVKPKSADALYWTSLCVGSYSQSIGILTALREGVEAKFRDPLVAVSKSDPKIDHGGVWNALGRYKFELPWPKKDLAESVTYLRRALEINPQNLRARVYLAESLEDRDDDGDVEEAKRLLKEVLAAPAARYDPAEELRAKAFARAAATRLKWDLK